MDCATRSVSSCEKVDQCDWKGIISPKQTKPLYQPNPFLTKGKIIDAIMQD